MADKVPHTVGGQGALAYIAEQLRPLALPIDSLTPDAANARRHPEKNMEAIVGSLSRFGQRLPIVVQKQGMIVRAGNGRIEAAKRLGWTHIAAVVVDESAVEATAFAIADNRSGELAEWDDETLASLLNTLPEDVLPATGFSGDDLGGLLSKLGNGIEGIDAPELPSGDKAPFQQMTFVVTDDQAADIKAALQAAKDAGPFVDTGNENSNGNALARLAEAYIG